MSMYNRILGRAKRNLIPFNKDLLLGFKENQIKKSAEYIGQVYKEAVKLLDGQLTYVGYRYLSPEERVTYELRGYKNKAKAVEILPTDLNVVRYEFEFNNIRYYSYMHLPFLRDHAITISGTKYYLQFVIADHVFFHMKNGLGIKVLRGPITFRRDFKFAYTSMAGKTYIDDIIRVIAHYRKTNKRDLQTTLVLYLLIRYGFYGVLDKFNIPEHAIKFVLANDPNDVDNEYFKIRGVCDESMLSTIPTIQDLEDSKNKGFFLRVSKDLLQNGSLPQRRIVSSLLYSMQYFDMCNSNTYKSNDALIDKLHNSDAVYKTILGKTLYGMEVSKESQAHQHAEQHLDGFDVSYLDEFTKFKLREYSIECENIYDLFVYVFCNIDDHIVNHNPMCLYGKKFSVNEILLSGIVQAIFKKIYAYTKHKRPLTDKEVSGIVRVGSREITKLFKHNSLVRSSKNAVNDNYLLSQGGKKTRATGSGSGNTSSKNPKARSKKNIAEREELFANSTMFIVESANSNPHQNPGLGGSLNPFSEANLITGVITEPAHAEPVRAFDRILISK